MRSINGGSICGQAKIVEPKIQMREDIAVNVECINKRYHHIVNGEKMMKKHYIDSDFNRLCGGKGDYAISKSDVTCEKCLDKIGIARDGSILTPIKCNFCNKKLSLNQIFEKENAVDLHCCHCGIAMVIDGFQDEQIILLKEYVKLTELRLDNM